MEILLTGSHGLIGSALLPRLAAAGHRVRRLVRSRTVQDGEFRWNPEEGYFDPAALEGSDAVVHLAGENIAERWTLRKKQQIRRSRIEGTRLLSERLCSQKRPPGVLVAASAIGYYGNRGDELLREESVPGAGFLADVCREWEAAAEAAAGAGIRVVRLRFGMILSRDGGALARMLPVFRLGLGGKLGSGKQYISWIAVDDVTGVVVHALNALDLVGPVNTVAPSPVTNLEFTKVLGKVLGRPTFLSVPATAIRLVFGEMGRELLLSSARAEPAKLHASGYAFRYPELESALKRLLGNE